MAPEHLTIVDKGSYVLVEFRGEFSVAAGMRCVDAMAEACEKVGQSRALLDCRGMTGDLPVIDRFKVAEYGSSKQPQLKQLALVNREDVVLADNFVENVASNRGLNTRIFTDMTEAQRWLSESARRAGRVGSR